MEDLHTEFNIHTETEMMPFICICDLELILKLFPECKIVNIGTHIFDVMGGLRAGLFLGRDQ